MRVNSTFKGFFNYLLAMRPGIVLVLLAIFLIASSFTKRSDRDLKEKQVNLMIRQIGHQLLLQAGDSTSRVLPVTEVQEGTFLLQFENEFVFNHDSLMALTHRLLPKTQFPAGYTVTVHECTTDIIVYGFQINNTSPDILACRGRSQPRGCYTIEIVFRDLYKSLEHKKADIDQVAEQPQAVKIDSQEPGPKPEELKLPAVDVQQTTARLATFTSPQRKADTKPEDLKKTTFNYPLISLVCSGMLVLFSVGLLIGRFRRRSVPVATRNQDLGIIKESVHGLAGLGKFLFDVRGQRLILGAEVISLTEKECRVLELLNENFGELISRETMMEKIWLSEGVITGRSLDMFVSKLRKKLSGDPELKITNVHGKGYKLEITGVQAF